MNNIIKKILLLFTVLIICIPHVNAQKQKFLPLNLPDYDDAPYHFGFTITGLYSGFRVKTVDDYYNIIFQDSITELSTLGLSETVKINNIQPKSSFGFSVGIVSNFRLNDYFDFRVIPGLSLTFRHIDLNFIRLGDDGLYHPYNELLMKELRKDMTIECVYIDLPILLKYKGKRMRNVRPYMIGGLEYRFDVLALAPNIAAKKDDFILTKPHDLYGTFGTGFDIYMFWFKFGIELRMSYGIFNVLNENLTNSIPKDCIENIHSKHFQITFTFE
ncbi:MAG: porin family protein [Bacteroidales bacterium]|jgi:hypothetical protein